MSGKSGDYEDYKNPKIKKLSSAVKKVKKKVITETIPTRRMPKLNTKPQGRFHSI